MRKTRFIHPQLVSIRVQLDIQVRSVLEKGEGDLEVGHECLPLRFIQARKQGVHGGGGSPLDGRRVCRSMPPLGLQPYDNVSGHTGANSNETAHMEVGNSFWRQCFYSGCTDASPSGPLQFDQYGLSVFA